MIRALIFDLDGTLFDRDTSVRRCVEAQHARFPGILSGVSQAAYVSRFLELDARGYTTKDIVYGQLSIEHSLPHGSTEILYDDFYANYHRHAVGFPHLHGTLEALCNKGFVLGMITNGGELHQRTTIQALAIESYFDAILISEAEGLRKPDPRIFNRALERLGVGSHETAYVGDHPQLDVEGAQAAGLTGVWKREPYWGDCSHADAIVDDLSALLSYLARQQ